MQEMQRYRNQVGAHFPSRELYFTPNLNPSLTFIKNKDKAKSRRDKVRCDTED